MHSGSGDTIDSHYEDSDTLGKSNQGQGGLSRNFGRLSWLPPGLPLTPERLRGMLEYEKGAAEGKHLCNDFNKAACVPEKRQHEIDINRRETARQRIIELDAELKRLENVDNDDGGDHDGGGAPPVAGHRL